MTATIDQLRARYAEVHDISMAASVLQWDQEVMMPPKGAAARGKQLATLSALAHRLFVSPEMGALLEDLQQQAGSLTGDDAILLNETRYEYARATRLPEAFVKEFTEAQSNAYHAWVKAREASDFSLFAPHLETVVDLNKRKADYFGYEDSPYDALLEEFERGMTTAALRGIFSELAERQKDLVARIMASSHQPDTSWLGQCWDTEAQWQFTVQVVRELGYDFDAGRQDKSVHPFTTNFDINDVRITTRLDESDLFSALTGSIHECGHALYEQGFRAEDARTILAQAISLGIHESQSRLWENMAGRSLPFWKHYALKLRAAFNNQLAAITPEAIYAAINKVEPSLIRVEADECTYNLHIILRFELEVDLIEGNLKIADVPEAWNAKVKDYLGLDVPNDAQGCLQDIHWSHAAFGYFPPYALGNLYAAQLMQQIERDIPELWQQVEQGAFANLREWLRANVHQHGRRMLAPDLIEHVTGQAPTSQPFLDYLERKYAELYRLP